MSGRVVTFREIYDSAAELLGDRGEGLKRFGWIEGKGGEQHLRVTLRRVRRSKIAEDLLFHMPGSPCDVDTKYSLTSEEIRYVTTLTNYWQTKLLDGANN